METLRSIASIVSIGEHWGNVVNVEEPPGVDSSYNVQTNVSVRRGVIGGNSVHNIHNGEL